MPVPFFFVLSHPEQSEIRHALELRLQAVARVDPRFIRFFQRLNDEDYWGDSVNASPYMMGSPLDTFMGITCLCGKMGKG